MNVDRSFPSGPPVPARDPLASPGPPAVLPNHPPGFSASPVPDSNATVWQAGRFRLATAPRALVMGILNVTPDSFSDGGRFFAPEAAVAHALEMEAQGADLIDVGGESSRPNAAPVDEAEEMRRVLPVLERLAGRVKVPVSIDTQKPAVARAACERGAAIINDIGAYRSDPAMAELVARTGVGYVVMHMQGTPQTMQRNPTYRDVVAEVDAFFAERLAHLTAVGIAREQVALDVGIGFGKTLEHNLKLLAALRQFTKWERPLLLGVSRKSFIDQLLGVPMTERLPAALACAGWAVNAGTRILRVHDVAATVQALRMTEAILAHQTA
jgi:dihydropteroate synthase